MTSNVRSAASRRATGGGPVPASTTTVPACVPRAAPSACQRSASAGARASPAHTKDTPATTGIARSISRFGVASDNTQSWMPGSDGSGRPNTDGRSPSRSTSRAGGSIDNPIAATTTVVPLPPFAAQHNVSMTTSMRSTITGGSRTPDHTDAHPRPHPIPELSASDARIGHLKQTVRGLGPLRCSTEVSGHLVGSTAFKAAGTGDPCPAGSIPVHLRQVPAGHGAVLTRRSARRSRRRSVVTELSNVRFAGRRSAGSTRVPDRW